ncbi:101 kDa malaria antigen-like [Coccinella septempunctata]|uniref:101 kDa malaria antigen-like n=1 Tax=Coccinella septempunctata TaxID=41139 RepID=UPI001D0806EA|nr:101 kDa malaria antigen-like [Coccinella septempunctata]
MTIAMAEGTTRVTLLPFYGGGKGQSLQIVENANGTVTTNIIKTPDPDKDNKVEEINPAELEYPQLPSKFEKKFDDHVRLINMKALNILSLQDKAKKKGQLTKEEQLFYQENMDEISEAAEQLTKIQEKSDPDFENREGLSAWFEKKNKLQAQKRVNKTTEVKTESNNNEKNKEQETSKWWNKVGEDSKKEEQEKKEKEKEEEKGEKEEENGDDTVEINLPPDNASVAEAMPVGLAVAGEGGIAASKPVATAVVGPNGLAVARPIATAIAGVAPDQALVPIYAEGYVGSNKPKRNGSQSPKQGDADEFLKRIISKFHSSAIPDLS